jgi:preprotein translocase subunit YajC
MTTTDPYVTLVFFALIGLLLLGLFAYVEWREQDRYRRLERKAHRSIQRGIR